MLLISGIFRYFCCTERARFLARWGDEQVWARDVSGGLETQFANSDMVGEQQCSL